jgi:hypothetical protein
MINDKISQETMVASHHKGVFWGGGFNCSSWSRSNSSWVCDHLGSNRIWFRRTHRSLVEGRVEEWVGEWVEEQGKELVQERVGAGAGDWDWFESPLDDP